jgi:hypothetical protein
MTDVLGTPTEQLYLLIKDTTQLAERLGQVEEHTAGTREQLRGLDELDKQIKALKKAVDRLQPQEEPPAVLWDWTTMDQQQALQAWEELRAWVDDVLDEQLGLVAIPDEMAKERTNLRVTVPPCWYRHPDVVWELSWLCQEWTKLYREGGTSRQAGDWWDRWLPGVLRRMVLSPAFACTSGHVSPAEPAQGKNPQAEWENVVGEDIAGRPAPKPKGSPESDNEHQDE